MVIYGASEASLVATELAAAKIPLILTSTRPAPDSFEKLDVQTGPPLSRSPAAILLESGVKLAIDIGNTGMFVLPLLRLARPYIEIQMPLKSRMLIEEEANITFFRGRFAYS